MTFILEYKYLQSLCHMASMNIKLLTVILSDLMMLNKVGKKVLTSTSEKPPSRENVLTPYLRVDTYLSEKHTDLLLWEVHQSTVLLRRVWYCKKLFSRMTTKDQGRVVMSFIAQKTSSFHLFAFTDLRHEYFSILLFIIFLWHFSVKWTAACEISQNWRKVRIKNF